MKKFKQRLLAAATLFSATLLAGTPVAATALAATPAASTTATSTAAPTLVKTNTTLTVKAAGAKVYSDPQLTKATGRTLPQSSRWLSSLEAQDAKYNVLAYRVSTHEWVAASDVLSSASTAGTVVKETGTVFVIAYGGASTYSDPGTFQKANGSLKYYSGWHYTAVYKNSNGVITAYQVSTHQWLPATSATIDGSLYFYVVPRKGIVKVTNRNGVDVRSAVTGKVNGHLAYGTSWLYTGVEVNLNTVVTGYQVSRDQFVNAGDVSLQ